ncbi:MAG: DinB family protein [Bacteroidia bacterium]
MDINYHFHILKTTRERAVGLLNRLTPKQLNQIPAGFNNNIIWNAAHCLATQNLLTYGLCGQPFETDHTIIDKFRKGTSPIDLVPQANIDHIKQELLKSSDLLLKAYSHKHFKHFTPYTTSYGITLDEIDNAIAFNNTHEGLHLGVMMAQAKLV